MCSVAARKNGTIGWRGAEGAALAPTAAMSTRQECAKTRPTEIALAMAWMHQSIIAAADDARPRLAKNKREGHHRDRTRQRHRHAMGKKLDTFQSARAESPNGDQDRKTKGTAELMGDVDHA